MMTRTVITNGACDREKLALFTQVSPRNVLSVHDVPNVYHVPLILAKQGAHRIIAETLRIAMPVDPRLGIWRVRSLSLSLARWDRITAIIISHVILRCGSAHGRVH